jgi:elongator complex protein 4
MASFRRAAAATAIVEAPVIAQKLPGTKAFINNQVLTSSGLRELDTIIGGGIMLGSLSIVESAVFGSYSLDILRYFAGEGLASGQHVATDKIILDMLPLELSIAQKRIKAEMSTPKLTIAWQYEKYNNRTSPSSDRLCHSFDLSKPMSPEMKSSCKAVELSPTNDIYRSLYTQILTLLSQDENSVLRVALSDVGSPMIYGDNNEVYLVRFVRALRALLYTYRHRFVCMISVPMYAMGSLSIAATLRHLADYDFEVTSFSGDLELPAELQYVHFGVLVTQLFDLL